ncbi:MAG: YlbF family regulator [Gemmatimonadota bacterium]
MSKIEEMAKDLGQALGRTDEYQALKSAAEKLDEDRDLVTLRREIETLESEMVAILQSGREPDEEARTKYEGLAEKLQGRSEYQRLVSAQSNFDKLLQKVNETISTGIRDGASSRIILP